MQRITNHELSVYEKCLRQEEKSQATLEKYMRDIRHFLAYLEDRTVSKEETIAYKEYLTQNYAPVSVNSMLVAVNGFLRFVGLQKCCVRLMKIQRQIFCRVLLWTSFLMCWWYSPLHLESTVIKRCWWNF